MKKIESSKQVAFRISTVSISVNLILAFVKLFAGILGKSGAMISDAIHSASDIFSTVIVLIGVGLAAKDSDEDHPYGHDRIECVASIILAVVLFATGVGIGLDGLQTIANGGFSALEIPTMLPLVVAVLSIAVKEWMYWYTKIGAKKINSGALMADAWHHRTDALSSVGAFVGILGARMGFPVCDAVASVVICVFIVKAAYDVFKDAMDKMVDKACEEETIEALEKIICETKGVERLDLLQTRLFASKIYVDVEIAMNGNCNLFEAHRIAEEVHDKIEKGFPKVKHCMVHVNPI
ncbi:MAG: cation diffusion facilitator family transporter [Eubacteriales bacterium]